MEPLGRVINKLTVLMITYMTICHLSIQVLTTLLTKSCGPPSDL